MKEREKEREREREREKEREEEGQGEGQRKGVGGAERKPMSGKKEYKRMVQIKRVIQNEGEKKRRKNNNNGAVDEDSQEVGSADRCQSTDALPHQKEINSAGQR